MSPETDKGEGSNLPIEEPSFKTLTSHKEQMGWGHIRRIRQQENVNVLYAFEEEYHKKSLVSLDKWLGLKSAYIPFSNSARGAIPEIPYVNVENVGDLNENVRNVDPDVLVVNNIGVIHNLDEDLDYPIIYLQHGANVGRAKFTGAGINEKHARCDVVMAPGEKWKKEYLDSYPELDVEVVGIPEADDLVGSNPPCENRILFAGTSTCFGGGCYTNVIHDAIDVVEGNDEWELVIRPHPLDVTRKPGREVTEEVQERIAEIPNIRMDTDSTPKEAILESDILVTDDSGILTEWLHTKRPVIQIDDLQAQRGVNAFGKVVDSFPEIDLFERLVNSGYSDWETQMISGRIQSLGIPMDGNSGKRAADLVHDFVLDGEDGSQLMYGDTPSKVGGVQ